MTCFVLDCVSSNLFQREKRNMSTKRSSPEGSPVFVDSVLRKHVTPITMTPKIKTNPLYSDMVIDVGDNPKSKPSWTIQEYDRQTLHGNLGDYLKVAIKTSSLKTKCHDNKTAWDCISRVYQSLASEEK